MAGVVSGFVVAGIYLVGAGRAFDFDASLTVSRFVATESMLDPFRRQEDFNNHPLFSFLEHLVYSATGSTDELVLRLLPIAASAGAVGLLVWTVGRRLGVVAGLCAGLVVATNSLVVDSGREVRGYSLLLLCAVAVGILIVDERIDARRGHSIALLVATAAGTAPHVFMAAYVAVLLALLWRQGRLRPVGGWLVAGVGAGLLAYPFVLGEMIDSGVARSFDATFPAVLLGDLAGGEPLAVALLIPLAGIGAWPVARKRKASAIAAASLGVLILAWAVIAPTHLYSRFFIWALPAVGLAVAAAVARLPALALVVVVAATAAFVPQVGGLDDDAIPNREVGTALRNVPREESNVCGLGWPTLALDVYVGGVRRVEDRNRLARCDVVVAVIPGAVPELVTAAADVYPYRYAVGRRAPALVLSAEPLGNEQGSAELLDGRPADSINLHPFPGS